MALGKCRRVVSQSSRKCRWRSSIVRFRVMKSLGKVGFRASVPSRRSSEGRLLRAPPGSMNLGNIDKIIMMPIKDCRVYAALARLEKDCHEVSGCAERLQQPSRTRVQLEPVIDTEIHACYLTTRHGPIFGSDDKIMACACLELICERTQSGLRSDIPTTSPYSLQNRLT